jgi:hypothetical protein
MLAENSVKTCVLGSDFCYASLCDSVSVLCTVDSPQAGPRQARTAVDQKITAEDSKDALNAAMALVKPNLMERLMAGETKMLQSGTLLGGQ